MNKNILASIAVAATLIVAGAFAPSASALTIDEIQTQIKELLAQVAALTRQMNALKPQADTTSTHASTGITPSPATHRICSVLYRNLSQGIQGDDVQGLQEFLKTEGYLSTQATGYFGPATREAVAKWQASQGVSSVGSFGPLSRERIKIWCGESARFSVDPQRGLAPLTVTFKALVGGFTPYRYAIDFGDGSTPQEVRCSAPADACEGPAIATHIYSIDGTYTAVLWQFGSNGSVNDSTRVALGKEQINVGQVGCTKEYMPVCGSKPIVCITTPCNPIQQTYGNRCMMSADSATFLYEGQCRATNDDPANDLRCKAWYDGCNNCSREMPNSPGMCTLRACVWQAPAYCTAYFENSSDNKPPVISGFSGPTTLTLNTSGTWTINASDPENGQLSYQVWWGDENVYAAGMNSSASREFVQATTFTHAYANMGTYTVTIVVHDATGKEAKTSSTVKVGSDYACTMQYDPVCGQPPEPACRHSIPACMMATPGPQTYGNRCMLNAAGATFLYGGACSNSYWN